MSYTIFLVLIIIVAVLLVLIIMVQNPKGGGLSSSFGGGGGGSQSVGGGVQNTTSFLDKSTWTLSIALLALVLLSNFALPNRSNAPTNTTIQNTLDDREIQKIPAEEPATTTLDSIN
ncbi:MAG: preprotein translocase subunit SecG [Flavobacteriaceae bacterium]|nr:preprotein translocase subunit SecG [Flavobacteriaceae bacterium]